MSEVVIEIYEENEEVIIEAYDYPYNLTKEEIDALGIDAATVNGYEVNVTVPVGAVFTDTTYTVGDGGLTEKNFTTALKSKLDGIESGATGDQTQSEINALNIDADKVDGYHAQIASGASTIPVRDSSQWLYAVNFDTGSDIRWKYDVKFLKKGTDGMISRSYKMKNGKGEILYGFIAQELKKTHPELVHENEKGYLSISMNGIIPLLLNDINRLKQFSLIYKISRLFNRIFKKWQ